LENSMSEDEPFLRAILAAPEDMATRLIYADWLEERGDARAEYLRLGAQLAALPVGHQAGPGVRRRMIELRTRFPAPWLALLGDHRSSASDPDRGRVELAAGVLGRPPRFLDDGGHALNILAAAAQPLTDALAYVESRSGNGGLSLADLERRIDGRPVDWTIGAYHLHVRDRSGRTAAWELAWYGDSTYPCDVRFLEWYGNVALVIYREKHNTYVCRFGLDSPPVLKAIGSKYESWVLDGRHLGHRGYREEGRVRRLAIPGLEELPPLSAEEAAQWQLLPDNRW
jgi:uncharacterized protein (TIGR02996 family)